MHRSDPITTARLSRSPEGVPFSDQYGDIYHPMAGALEQARHVFLGGNGLPARWAGQHRHVILETGFGLGNNFLATWAAWRDDPRRCERLVHVAVEKHPLRREDLAEAHRGHHLPELAEALVAAWPAPTPDLHLLDFEDGRVRLMLAFGDAETVLAGLQLQADSVYLDGFSPACNAEMWSASLFRRLPRLLAPGAHASTWSAARVVRDGLHSAGFIVEPRPGIGGKRDITVARHAPRHVATLPVAWAPRAWPVRPESTEPDASASAPAGIDAGSPSREAIVVGAGLSGCAAAFALARQGWKVRLLDSRAAPAQDTSGNAGGLMHAIVNQPDSLHSRWFRAAALRTTALARPWLEAAAGVGDRSAADCEDTPAEERHGQLAGLLRLAPKTAGAAARAQLEALGLPPEVVDWVDAAGAASLSGLPASAGAWRFGHAGWLSPQQWCLHLLRLAGESVRFQGRTEVAAIRRCGGSTGGPVSDIEARARWEALDAAGRVVATAPVLVLANAGGALELLARCPDIVTARPPSRLVRGQTTLLDLESLEPHQRAQLLRPRLPVAGGGYAIDLGGSGAGRLLVGATTQSGDPDPNLRLEDQHDNLHRAAALGLFGTEAMSRNRAPDWALALPLRGRVGWRLATPDRLPIVGPPVDLQALADLQAAGARTDAARLLPRCHDRDAGVYLCCALGSRGITSALLAGELLAAWVTGAPCPVDTDLRDALDPARFALRRKPA